MDARGLVSIQALCALTLYLGGSETRDLTRITMEEWFDNLTSEALDSSYLGKIPEFYNITRLAK